MTSDHEKSTKHLNHRKQQMMALIEFRPYWIMQGDCTDGKKAILKAGDASCPCNLANFSCSIHAITERELSQIKQPA